MPLFLRLPPVDINTPGYYFDCDGYSANDAGGRNIRPSLRCVFHFKDLSENTRLPPQFPVEQLRAKEAMEER